MPRLTPRRRVRLVTLVNMHTEPPIFGLKKGRRVFAYAAKLMCDGGLEWYEIDRRRYVGKYTLNDLWTPATYGVLDIRSRAPLVPKDMNYYFGE